MKTILIIIGLLSISLTGCTTGTPSNNTHNSIQNNMSKLSQETKALIGSAKCSSSNQCHYIGFGDKPCGGFTSFRIYSDQNTDVTLLKSKVAQYNTLSKQWNSDNNVISNCMMLMPPELTCRSQTCQIK